MAIRIASFVSVYDRGGWLLYDSVTMYIYPILFSTPVEIERFLEWYEVTYREPFYGSTKGPDDPYHAYELYVKEHQNPRR